MPDLLAPRRSAHASIRGYLYQSLLGVERWLRLDTGGEAAQAILCEGDEDLDTLLRDGVVASEQVKDYSGSLGIGDRVVRETLARFLVSWVELRHRGDERRFVFTTTTARRAPRGGIDVLGLWKEPDRRDELVQGVRDWSRSAAGEDTRQVDEALAWLDENRAWEPFFGAVDWGFDAPGYDATRTHVADLLAERGIAAHLRDLLTDCLLAAVLEASVQDEVEDRVLTAPDLTRLLQLTQQEILEWAGNQGLPLRLALEHEKKLRLLLSSGREPLPETEAPSQLLVARYEVVPFEEEGRREELRLLTEWSAQPGLPGVLLLHGPGGAGKTRLLIESCRRLRHQGWHAGFLDRDAEPQGLEPLFEGKAPRLVVIDYGETRPGLVRALLHRLARLPETGGPKTRVVLLARTAGEWWREIQREDDLVRRLVASSPPPVEVNALVPAIEERPVFVDRAARAFAAARGLAPPESNKEGDLTHPRYERVLYLHLAALLRLLGDSDGGHDPNGSPLATVLEHERRAWWRHLEESMSVRSVPESTKGFAGRAMAVLTLVRGATSEDEAHSLVELAAPRAGTETSNRLVDLFHRLYPATDGRFVAPLEPDLLGEELVRQVLAEDPALLGRLLKHGDARQAHDPLVVVGRLLLDETLPPVLAEQVLTRVDAERHLPVSLREAAATATERVLRKHRATHPEPDDATWGKRARLINSLSNRLAALGRREEALEAIDEAVEIRRRLANARPNAFLPRLAQSLNNRSNRLAALGRREEALEAIDEAVEIRRGLAATRPDAFLPRLAQSLNNRSNRLAALGRREEALEAIDQAVDAYRQLATARPDAFLPDLAGSLNNRSNRLADLGRHEEALEAIDQAVRIRRQLADVRPDAFRPDLAQSFNNRSLRLADLGRHEDALEAIDQAVKIRHWLADARPDAFLPDLAGSLNNRSGYLAELGRREEALEAIDEAVRTLAPFFLRLPEAFAGWMRTMVRGYLARCDDTGTVPDATLLGPIEEALARLESEEDGGSPPVG